MRIIVRVRELRKHHNLTQEELAKQLKISRQSLISLEQGRWLPSLPLAVQLASFFNASLEDVIQADQQTKKSQLATMDDPKEEPMARELTPWLPLRELQDMRQEMDRIVDQNIYSPHGAGIVFPTVNMRQDETNIYLETQVPGFNQEQIDIDVADDYVTISGTVIDAENGSAEHGYLRQEYQQQSFSRTIGLPQPVLSDKAEAKMAHGVLTITLPKIEAEKPKTKRLKPTI